MSDTPTTKEIASTCTRIVEIVDRLNKLPKQGFFTFSSVEQEKKEINQELADILIDAYKTGNIVYIVYELACRCNHVELVKNTLEVIENELGTNKRN